MPRSAIARRNPRLVIVVVTTASPGSARARLQVEGQDRQDLIAVHQLAGVVDRQHPVAVPVEGEPELMAALAHRRPERVGVRRAALLVDVDPVGGGVDDRHPGARVAAGPRGAVTAVAPLAQSITTDTPSRRAGKRSIRLAT